MKIHPGKSSFLIFFLAFVTIFSIFPQVPQRVISTLSMATAPRAIPKKGSLSSFPQSIGQSSVTGAFNNNGVSVRQGFIQPVRIIGYQPSALTLNADIYPNPFKAEIVISFSEVISERIHLTLYDLRGKILFSQESAVVSVIRLPVSSIPAGFYILKIKTGTKLLTRKIIKTVE